jgi:hypothetical protein
MCLVRICHPGATERITAAVLRTKLDKHSAGLLRRATLLRKGQPIGRKAYATSQSKSQWNTVLNLRASLPASTCRPVLSFHPPRACPAHSLTGIEKEGVRAVAYARAIVDKRHSLCRMALRKHEVGAPYKGTTSVEMQKATSSTLTFICTT